MKTKLSALTLLHFVLFTFAPAQDPPMEWGEILPSDLAMQRYDADTNAAALILGDFGSSFINDDFNIEFRRHLRIKIFSQRGYDIATHRISYVSADDEEIVDDLEGVTYFLNEEGDIEEVELDDDDIKEENVTEYVTRLVFTMPALRPGCIIEIQYRIVGEHLSAIRDWEFQWSEPVRWSEYRLKTPKNVSYAAVYQGFEPYDVSESREENGFFSSTAASMLGRKLVECRVQRWVLKDAPAVREEPYMTSVEDYINRVDLQLSQTAFSFDGVRNYINSWDLYAEELLDFKNFGPRMEPNGDIRDKVSEILGDEKALTRKARKIYDWVVNTMTWDGRYRTYALRDPDEILESTSGSSAELSFLLCAMYRAAGIDADPVLISTRSNRAIQTVYPIDAQFNHVVVRVDAGGLFTIDACDRNRPFHLAPLSVLNRRGFLLGTRSKDFVTVSSERKDATIASMDITLAEDGTIDGTVEVSYQEYAAVNARKTMRDKDEPDRHMIKTLVRADERGITVDSCSSSAIDSINHPMNVRGHVSGPSGAIVAGDLMYVNPHLVLTFDQTPLRLHERKYPVDYSSPQLSMAEVRIAVPAGYAVKSLPKSHTVSGAKGTVEFSRVVKTDQSAITVAYSLRVAESSYPATQYGSLRDVYAAAAQSFGEQIVLEKQ